MPGSPEALLHQLALTPEGSYPRSLVEEMMARPEEMTPALLHVLDHAAQDPDLYLADENWLKLTFSSYLLAQFGESRAFPALLRLLALPPRTVQDLFGDLISSGLGRILASVYSGDEAPLRNLLEDPSIHDYVRGCSIVQCLQCLVHSGRITLRDFESYFSELLDSRLEREPSVVWDSVVCACGELGLERLLPSIQKAFEEGLCDPSFDTWENVRGRILRGGAPAIWQRHATLIRNTLLETEWWDYFQAHDLEMEIPPYLTPEPEPPNPLPAPPPLAPPAGPLPPKPGRNEPCPCGSGKKYKKCCGAATT